jgi:hypothetical protein
MTLSVSGVKYVDVNLPSQFELLPDLQEVATGKRFQGAMADVRETGKILESFVQGGNGEAAEM